MGADARGRYPNSPIDVIRKGPVPRRMPLWSAALAALLGIGCGLAIGFETGSVLSVEASSQLGVLLFQTLVIGAQGGVLLLDSADKVTIAKSVILGIGDKGVSPFGGKAAEMRTGIPIGT